jgi:hypothetical protein
MAAGLRGSFFSSAAFCLATPFSENGGKLVTSGYSDGSAFGGYFRRNSWQWEAIMEGAGGADVGASRASLVRGVFTRSQKNFFSMS